MLKDNNLTWKHRIKELIIDYICILLYLTLLLSITLVIYLVILKGIPKFNELHSQLLACFSSVVPIILIFSFFDNNKGSIGKQKAGLKLYYKNKDYRSSLVRNIIKFLPWQLAHIGVIRGMYTNFDLLSLVFTISSIALSITMLIMGIVRKDKRHLGDLIAGTQTQLI